MPDEEVEVDRPLDSVISPERQESLNEITEMLRKAFKRHITKLFKKSIKDCNIGDCEQLLRNKKAFVKDLQALISKHLE